MDGSAIGLKVAIEAIKKVTPKGLAWITSYVVGKDILLLGAGGVGKSSFSDYLQFGMLEDESEHDKTHSIEASPVFELSTGRDNALKLHVRNAVDTPGQIGPVAHAELVKEKKPHAILIIFDLTKDQSVSIKWLEEFVEHLDSICKQNPRILKRLKSIIIVLNKYDRCSKKEYSKKKTAINKSTEISFKSIFGLARAKKIPVLPCISVTNEHDSKYIDAVIRKLAKELV